MPVLIRYVAGLTAGSIAFLAGWFAVVHVIDVLRIKRESNRVTGWVTSWTTKGGFRAEVELGTTESPNRVWVLMNNDYNVGLARDVEAYIHPTDPTRSRLGGFFQFWVSPLVLAFTCILFAVPAAWILTAPGPGSYTDALPAEWAGRWVWFSNAPWPEAAGDLVLKFPSYYWKGGSLLALFLVALVGAPVLYQAVANREELWHGRLVGGSFALLLTTAFIGLALHCSTFRMEADDRSVREKSVLGWREVPWASVARLEDESVRAKRWNASWHRWETGLPVSQLDSLVLVNDKGKKMLSIGVQLEPPSARRRLTELIRQKTGLTPAPTERHVLR